MLKPDQIRGKNVLLRADLEDSYRLQALLSTLSLCLQHAKHTIIIGHKGRPEGVDPKLSLKTTLAELKRLINSDISFIPSGFSLGEYWIGENSVSLLENLRFDKREQEESLEFARELSAGADIYIYDAFATYRPCTSLSQIPKLLPTIPGTRFQEEVDGLTKALINPVHPTLLIASGAKMDKLEIINSLAPKFDQVLLGGKFVGSESRTPDGLDLNENTIRNFEEAIKNAGTIVFNGPVGKYEDQNAQKGTKKILEALKNSSAFTIIGGGDTLAAIPHLGYSYTQYGFVSTGGGAMLFFLKEGTHPLLKMLN
jgi:3-phosphoglycerate kinase